MQSVVGQNSTIVLGRGTAASTDAVPITYAHFGPADRDQSRATVVLSHGAGGNHAVWFQQVPTLARYFDVVSWDHRGFGTTPRGPSPASVTQSCDDLEAVLNHLEISSPLHLVGQSMGGWTTTAFLLAWPERVASVVWTDTIAGMFTPALRAAYEQFAAGVQAQPTAPTSAPSTEARAQPIGEHPALDKAFSFANPELGFLYQELGAFAQPSMSEVRNALTGWSVDPQRVTRLAARKLIVAGEHDQLFPASGLAELAAIIGAEFGMIPGAGHSPYFERPDVFNDLLLAFLLDSPT